jgi:hypothetical protein
MLTLMSALALRGAVASPRIVVNGDTNPGVVFRTGSVTDRHTSGSIIVSVVRIGLPETFFLPTNTVEDEFFASAFPFVVFKAGTRVASVTSYDIGVFLVGGVVAH